VSSVDFEARPGLSALFTRQAKAAAANGSAMYAGICQAAALDLAGTSRLGDVLAPRADSRAGDMLPLRVLGAAHRLVLERQAPRLAMYYPSVGGSAPDDALGRGACYAAWVEALVAHADRLPELLAGPPQTNDPGRTAALAGALQLVASAYRLPIRVHELGASAGLNLLADQVRLTWPGGAIGPVDSPLHLAGAWEGGPVPVADVAPQVLERVGCDLDPIDVTSTEGRLRLTSFVWPDQLERLERLRAAYRLMETVPVSLVRSDLLDHLRSLQPAEGSALVVFHSSTWFYLDDEQRAEAAAVFDRLGSRAGPTSPVVHVAREYLGSAFASSHALVLQWWPVPASQQTHVPAPGAAVQYADSPAHGLPVTWQPPRPVDDLVAPASPGS
jgi:hypothetical protein